VAYRANDQHLPATSRQPAQPCSCWLSLAPSSPESKPAGDRYPSASAHRGMRGLAPVSGHPDDLANAAAELDRFIDDAGRLLNIQDGVDVEVKNGPNIAASRAIKRGVLCLNDREQPRPSILSTNCRKSLPSAGDHFPKTSKPRTSSPLRHSRETPTRLRISCRLPMTEWRLPAASCPASRPSTARHTRSTVLGITRNPPADLKRQVSRRRLAILMRWCSRHSLQTQPRT
jgi:hypothetical protein